MPTPEATFGLPKSMLAARLDTQAKRISVERVPLPSPGPRDVLIQVKACGICLSDIHLIDGTISTRHTVVTPGHEPAGIVTSVGRDVPRWRAGDRVIVDSGRSCGECESCARGLRDRCTDPRIIGVDTDGAWAQYVCVPFECLCPIPANLPFDQAALMADAVSTPFAALVHTADVGPGDSVGLWGIGGLGYHAVQIAALCGAAPVVAIDPRESARSRALQVGADVALDPTAADFEQRISEVTNGRGLDVAVDLVGSNDVLRQAERNVARRGRIVVVGLSDQSIQLGTSEVFGIRKHRLLGHLGYSREDLETVASLTGWGRLDLSQSVSATYPLSEIERALAHLTDRASDVIRVVVSP
ncbi:zinc-binding dehydrogenase [Nocardioides sp. NPDC006303]|uniref:zinc-binding dehydrogenase n=1 Tax=Nocardioides sp. NPDC006303 TaxID=3156747 RepID=UPI00339DD116